MKHTPLNIIGVILLVLLLGCESNTNSGSYTPPGHITGSVELRDTINQTVLKPDGATIRLEGTTFKTTSDSTGSWTLRDIPVGTYVLVYEKEGFGTRKIFNVQHTANGTLFLNSRTLRQLPQISLDVVLRSFENDRATFTGLLSSGLLQYGLNLRIGLYCSKKNATIDPLIESTFDATFSSSANVSDTIGYSIGVYRSMLLNFGYKPGDRVYVIAAAILQENYNNDYGYYDYARQKSIVTGFGLNYSPVKSFILP